MVAKATACRTACPTTRAVTGDGVSSVQDNYDSDAQTYFTAVEAADGEALESTVKDAINAFILGCKSDAIWNAIKAACILAGARTLDGALVPLVGAAPTNANFVSGDYSRTAGLIGNDSTKFLDTNRNNNADPQNSKSFGVFITQQDSGMSSIYLSTSSLNVSGDSYLFSSGTANRTTKNNQAVGSNSLGAGSRPIGLYGTSRAAAGSYTTRLNGTNTAFATSSSTPLSQNLRVFGSSTVYTNATIAFYWIGESLDLALLETRVLTLITAIGTALA